ncbi:MAG TPA: trypsin-like peptidase domain-containing protein [Candidatus Acidoferrales bacterium]|nr:trypsin-like peptidase domain-containing protein [Candidatus Acidoferrales bacterium]
MKLPFLIFVIAGVAGAQTAPPRKDIPAIAKAANGAIVSIVMSNKDGQVIAQGSGFLISKDGVILTNYHVIAEGSSAVVKLPDGATYVVDGALASDKARDIALIKAHGQDFRTLPLGDSDRVQVGEDVVAIGNPLSLESTVSNGILSGIRAVEEEGGKYLQITAPISPGSSGGPLFNMAGEVIGITTMYLKGGENLNFAIPINDAKRLLLAKSTQIQALPNEPEPVQAGTHAGDAPSPVASPPVQPPVEHAATAEQCEADARIWGSRPDWFVKQLPYTELQTRALEMGDCHIPGAQNEPTVRKNLAYLATSNLYESAMLFRMALYISRHDKWDQYMPERVPFLSITQNPPEHAPTLKQCNADELLWTQQNQAGMSDRLSSNELWARSVEMVKCAAEVTGRDFLAVATFGGYLSTELLYTATMVEQLHAYLLRHNEWSQFVSEDAAGVR